MVAAVGADEDEPGEAIECRDPTHSRSTGSLMPRRRKPAAIGKGRFSEGNQGRWGRESEGGEREDGNPGEKSDPGMESANVYVGARH